MIPAHPSLNRVFELFEDGHGTIADTHWDEGRVHAVDLRGEIRLAQVRPLLFDGHPDGTLNGYYISGVDPDPDDAEPGVTRVWFDRLDLDHRPAEVLSAIDDADGGEADV